MVIYDHVMSIERGDFFRLLPPALGGIDAWQSNDWGNNADLLVFRKPDDKCLNIFLGEVGERRIASLRLSTLPVKITADGFDEVELNTLMKRFEAVYQRGGG